MKQFTFLELIRENFMLLLPETVKINEMHRNNYLYCPNFLISRFLRQIEARLIGEIINSIPPRQSLRYRAPVNTQNQCISINLAYN